MRVLVVEDEAHARLAMQMYLETAGYEVFSAASGDEARNLLQQQVADILICDWRLGGEDSGVDVARIAQARAPVPVVFVTAQSLPELRDHAQDIRPAYFLSKPVSLQMLHEQIASIVGERSN